MSTNTANETQAYAINDVIVREGDSGGDLFLITEGMVQVYQVREDREIPLVILNAGELLGTATCMTNQPRLASAKALTHVVVRRIEHKKIIKQIGAFPDWMKTLVKDLNIRLNQMNGNFADAQQKARYLEEHFLSSLFLARQICCATAKLAESWSITVDQQKYLVIDDWKTQLSSILALEIDQVNTQVKIFIEVGLLVPQIEPDRKRKVIRLESALKLVNFAQFIIDYSTPKFKKIRKANFTYAELRVLDGLIQIAIKQNLALDKSIEFEIAFLEQEMEKLVGIKYEQHALDQAQDVGMLEIKPSADKKMLLFTPQLISHTVIHSMAYLKLMMLDESNRQQAQSGGGRAA